MSLYSRYSESFDWRRLAAEPLVVLARREGVGLHDAMLSSCRQAGFPPRLAYTPSLIGTVLSYVEAGAGVGIVPESVVTPDVPVAFVATMAASFLMSRTRGT